jgi:chloride channel 3/4/5
VRQVRKRKSVRGRAWNVLDRLTGWFVVTVVGFLSAVAAFLVVKSERWLFDLKMGHCSTGWWKAYAVCCEGFKSANPEDHCPQWEDWDETLHIFKGRRDSWLVE